METTSTAKKKKHNKGCGMRNPINQAIVVEGAVTGKKQTAMAALCGVSRTTIHRFLSRPDVRKEVEKQAIQVLKTIPTAAQLLEKTMTEALEAKVLTHPGGPQERGNDIKLRTLGVQVANSILGTAGIITAHGEARTTAAILVGGDTEEVSPVIQQLLGRILPGGVQQNVAGVQQNVAGVQQSVAFEIDSELGECLEE